MTKDLGRAVAHAPAGSWNAAGQADQVTLAFDDRHRRRIRLDTDGGNAVLLDLPRAVALADGDGLELESGGWIRVAAAPEAVMEVKASSPHHLLRLAWHIGNRHLPAQISEGAILLRPDHVIADMLRGLGATVTETVLPFQPEGGAYDHGHAHSHDHAHDHDHDHRHGHSHHHG
ncbi:urease accessory protein UreE [Nisaea acidiphila]|uniref:Urease accessory protein UreE n=1 Tax=Nisaea acidiphila TaxID=1862145 RepID=A0A9J7AWP9_9PROT|nr:urease accessory protein UreE [Nisaea acidiphila]UUX50676.1 urease accessory protein UreE [Nisaea acidiphila]